MIAECTTFFARGVGVLDSFLIFCFLVVCSETSLVLKVQLALLEFFERSGFSFWGEIEGVSLMLFS